VASVCDGIRDVLSLCVQLLTRMAKVIRSCRSIFVFFHALPQFVIDALNYVLDRARIDYSLFQCGKQLHFEAISPDRECVAAHAAIAVTGATILGVASFSLSADDHDPRATLSTN